MIPPFNEFGFLPSGVHPATFDEIDAHFGRSSEIRRVQIESVRWMIDLAAQAGAKRIVLNGSFVTDIIEPNDVDCVLLVSSNYPQDRDAADALDAGLPFLEIATVPDSVFDTLVDHFFATDRHGTPKGMVEVIGWD